MSTSGWVSDTTEWRLRWLGGGAFIVAGLVAISFFLTGRFKSGRILGFDAWLLIGTVKVFAGVALLLDGTPSPLSEYVDPVVVWAALWWYISTVFVVGFLLSGDITDLLFGVTLTVAIGITLRYRNRFLQIREYTTGEVGRATYLTLLLAVFVTVLEFNTLA